MTFRQSATDADNHLTTNVAAVYAQDQVELSRTCRSSAACASIASTSRTTTTATATRCTRPDNLVSPRAGVVYKPIAPMSIYSSYSVSYLPSSGDQFSSLTVITEQVKPEQFRNYEVGAKWDVRAGPVGDDRGVPPGPHEHALDRSERPDADRADRQPAHQRLRAGRQRTA